MGMGERPGSRIWIPSLKYLLVTETGILFPSTKRAANHRALPLCSRDFTLKSGYLKWLKSIGSSLGLHRPTGTI